MRGCGFGWEGSRSLRSRECSVANSLVEDHEGQGGLAPSPFVIGPRERLRAGIVDKRQAVLRSEAQIGDEFCQALLNRVSFHQLRQRDLIFRLKGAANLGGKSRLVDIDL